MTTRISTGLRNGVLGGLGLLGMLNKGFIKVFAGTQPLSADMADTSYTLLGTFTTGSGSPTKETRATGTITITGVGVGTINSISVGGLNIIPDGAVSSTASDTTSTLAVKLADAINRNGMFEARVATNVVTIRGRYGSGAITPAITGSLATVTATYGTPMSGGVNPAYGLILGPAGSLLGVETAGVIAKPSDQVWSCNAVADGTAGWYRYYSSDTADTGALLTAAPWYPRIDGSCGVGSGQLQLSTLAFVTGAPVTVDSWKFTMPAQ